MVKIINVNMKCLDEAVNIAFGQYEREGERINIIYNCSKNAIETQMLEAFQKQNGFACYENEKMTGYLVYDGIWEDNGTLWCNIPLWGYGAVGFDRMKIISILFQSLAEKMFDHQKLHFQVKLYAHDEEAIRIFSFLQFGIECEEGMRDISVQIQDTDAENTGFGVEIQDTDAVDIRELTKTEIMEKWDELWVLLQALVEHLRKSPVFYPGTEFTEDVYKEFLLDANTRVVVSQADEQLSGLITASRDGNSFINCGRDYYNVGDVYLKPQYRGGGLARRMLEYLSKTLAAEGIKKQWVEHGTANPNARGFWNKYFTTYAYTMIRDIEPF